MLSRGKKGGVDSVDTIEPWVWLIARILLTIASKLVETNKSWKKRFVESLKAVLQKVDKWLK